jgi:hypothetical protein
MGSFRDITVNVIAKPIQRFSFGNLRAKHSNRKGQEVRNPKSHIHLSLSAFLTIPPYTRCWRSLTAAAERLIPAPNMIVVGATELNSRAWPFSSALRPSAWLFLSLLISMCVFHRAPGYLTSRRSLHHRISFPSESRLRSEACSRFASDRRRILTTFAADAVICTNGLRRRPVPNQRACSHKWPFSSLGDSRM